MSTLVTVTVAGAGHAPSCLAAVEAAFAVFARVDEVMNEWRPGSPLSALNAAAGSRAAGPPPGRPLPGAAGRAGRGRADRRALRPDLGGAARRLALRRRRAAAGPRPTRRWRGACPLVSWRDLEIEPAGDRPDRTPLQARLRRAGMQVGLGGLAKGWGVDRAVAELRRRGLRDFTVQAGGDLYASGTRGGRPWRVGVRDPRGAPGRALRLDGGLRTPPSPPAATRSASSSWTGRATTTSSTPAPAGRPRRAARRACSRRPPSRPRCSARRSSCWAGRRGSRSPRGTAPRW